MKAKYTDIEDAFMFSDFGGGYESEAYLCKQTGETYYVSDYVDEEEPLPDDLDDGEKYILLPYRDELDMAHPRDFISEKMPVQIDKLNEIFNYKGAYRRFKDWLIQIDKIDDWYEYENKATEKALRNWCKENDIALVD